jgi:hypothetical protein
VAESWRFQSQAVCGINPSTNRDWESLPFTLVPRIWARDKFFQTVSDWESSHHLLKLATELGFEFHRSEAGQAKINTLFSLAFRFSSLITFWG